MSESTPSPTPGGTPTPTAAPVRDRRGRVYTPAVGSKLRPWLWLCLIGFAVLLANGAYLASVSAVTWWTGITQQTYFYNLMFIAHVLVGTAVILPFLVFGIAHWITSRKRPNKSAIYYGFVLLAISFLLLITGIILVQGAGIFEIRDPRVRRVSYWLHVVTPLVAIGLYVKHRLAGPRIRWQWARRGGFAVAGFVALMAALHAQEPRRFGEKGPAEGAKYFFPSEAVTSTGNFIPAATLMADDYCLKCHKDAYNSWFHSSHHFSSFNNPVYLFSVRETRKVALERDGTTQAARWCAGCHDPVPFFSGRFDNPNYDDVNDPTSQAGITCTSCHSITHVNSTRGNADYTIEEPQHYPFAFSTNPVLQWLNNTMVKAKPEMHKRTFMKPFMRDSKFCSTCHKVGLPYALNHYKDFLRGQNSYDTFLLSGVSGHGARSFYYPPKAKNECAECHMGLTPSTDFGAQDFDGKGGREIHDHFFPAANTGLATVLKRPDIAEKHAAYLKDGKVRIDIFGLREGGGIDGNFIGPIRPETPQLQPGKPYLVEVVVRTLGLGHPLTQGTVDSNELWVELIAKVGDKVIGRSGGIDEGGTVDPYAHFINVYMLDRNGKRIDRRNPQDIFVPLYNKQIPPGAGQVVHFALDVPAGQTEPITLEAKVNYRKFDRKYLDYIFGPKQGPTLPVVAMAVDRVSLPVVGGTPVKNDPSPIKDAWQRWNDYGIGLFLEGTDKGGSKGELKQAETAFQQVAKLNIPDGDVNLARVYIREGRIPDALAALERASKHPKVSAPWVINWLSAQIDELNGFLDEAISKYESVLNTRIPERGFDFSKDFEVNNALGNATYARARQEELDSKERLTLLEKTVEIFRRSYAIDTENVLAHYGLGLAYADLGRKAGNVKDLDSSKPVPTERLQALTTSAMAKNADPAARASAALDLASSVAAYVKAPRPDTSSRLIPLQQLVEKLGQARSVETSEEVRAAQALALAAAHKALHQMYKPDETAEGRAIGIAVKDNPAADQNARSIVIHPMHRAGAPGLTQSNPAPAAAPAPAVGGGE